MLLILEYHLQMHAIYDEPFRDNMLNYVDHLAAMDYWFYWSANEREKGKWELNKNYQFGLDWALENNKTWGYSYWHNSTQDD